MLESCAFESAEKQKMNRASIIANRKLQIKDSGQWTVGSGQCKIAGIFLWLFIIHLSLFRVPRLFIFVPWPVRPVR
jgi:hypothetical protein